jgi:magnesium chelatase subunit D
MRRAPGEPAFSGDRIQAQDLRSRLRVQPVRKTILFLVDASESMLVEEQMKLAKGAVLGLLTQAYQKRYRVGVISFRESHARVVLPPTTSITRARQALQAVETGGGTPMAHGFHTVLQTVRSERIRHPEDLAQMILITDGNPSVKMNPKEDIRQEILTLARKFPLRQIPAVVLATAEPGALLKEISIHLKAPLRRLRDVVRGNV